MTIGSLDESVYDGEHSARLPCGEADSLFSQVR